MPSYLASGLAEGISPLAVELFKSKLQEGREQRKPGAQLQSSLLDAVRSMSQAPTTADLQAGSDAAEANGVPGSRMDMNQVVSGLARGASPEMVGQANQGQNLMNTLQKMGITSLGGDSIGMNRYGSGMNQLGYFDQDTKEFVMSGEVPRGSIIKSAASSVDTTRDKAVARGEGYTEGRLNVGGIPQEQAVALTENRAVVRSADELLNLFDQNPGLFQKATTPGARATMLGDENVKRVNLWLENLKTHRALSIGGKTLTANEIQRVTSTLISFVRGETVSREALEEVKTLAEENFNFMAGSFAKSKIEEMESGNASGLDQNEEDLLNSLRQ